jgi:hypothetical protein
MLAPDFNSLKVSNFLEGSSASNVSFTLLNTVLSPEAFHITALLAENLIPVEAYPVALTLKCPSKYLKYNDGWIYSSVLVSKSSG